MGRTVSLSLFQSKVFVKPQHATLRQPTTAEDPTGYHSSAQQIGKRGYSLQELTKIGQLKTGKMLPGLMSPDFCWDISDGRVRIWCKQNENMDPSCLVTTVQAGGGGVMVLGMFSWHTLGPLVPIVPWPTWAFFLTMSIHLWPPCTHPLMATSSRIMHYVTKLDSFQIGFLNMTMSSLY